MHLVINPPREGQGQGPRQIALQRADRELSKVLAGEEANQLGERRHPVCKLFPEYAPPPDSNETPGLLGPIPCTTINSVRALGRVM